MLLKIQAPPEEVAFESLTRLLLHSNRIQGALPEKSFGGVNILQSFYAARNTLAGTIPGAGLRSMAMLQMLLVNNNRLRGTIPGGVREFTQLRTIDLGTNRLSGEIPGEGARRTTALLILSIHMNDFSGMCPQDLRHLTDMEDLTISSNRFAGALPEGAFQRMSNMVFFAVHANRFEGPLPTTGFQFTRQTWATAFLASSNSFSGTLPGASWCKVHFLALSDNYFQGSLPDVSSWTNLDLLLASQNLLAGTVPQAVVKELAVYGMVHEGTMPSSVSRMSAANTTLVFGHGLTGVFLPISATLRACSLFSNSLEGFLPEQHFHSESMVVVHGNRLSCRLPRNNNVQPSFSVALVGNHFAKPLVFPPWITMELPGGELCVSRYQGRNLLLLLASSVCLLALSYIRHRRTALAASVYEVLSADMIVARSLWFHIIGMLLPPALASCVLLLFYMSARTFTCMDPVEKLHFPASDQKTNRFSQVMMTAWMYRASTCFNGMLEDKRRPNGRKLKGQQDNVGFSRSVAYNLWLFFCAVLSAPAALFATIKAVPGFLGLQGRSLWLVSVSVSLLTATMTSLVLPSVARSLSTMSRRVGKDLDLQILGRLLVVPLIPCVLTVVCHADCLGAWVYFWKPCLQLHQRVFTATELVEIGVLNTLLSRSEACSSKVTINKQHCLDVQLERLSQILHSKFVHDAFTVPACRVLIGKPAKLRDASVSLAYIWLVVLMLGPCLPLLHPLAVVVVAIQAQLLFGCLSDVAVALQTSCHALSFSHVGFSFALSVSILIQVLLAF